VCCGVRARTPRGFSQTRRRGEFASRLYRLTLEWVAKYFTQSVHQLAIAWPNIWNLELRCEIGYTNHMDIFKKATCPSCRARLPLADVDDVVACEYCGMHCQLDRGQDTHSTPIYRIDAKTGEVQQKLTCDIPTTPAATSRTKRKPHAI
jgi:hypothetical protein